jgi:hypothetical protein
MRNVIGIIFLSIFIGSSVYAQSDAAQAKRIEDFKRNDNSGWTIKYFVNEWGDSTDKLFITTLNRIKGTFSSFITTDSDAGLEPIFSLPNNFAFKLYHYDRAIEKNLYSHTVRYSIQLEDSTGQRFVVYASLASGETTFYFDSTDRDTVLNCFLKGGRIRMFIKNLEENLNSYRFSISDTNGFAAAYYALTGKKIIN